MMQLYYLLLTFPRTHLQLDWSDVGACSAATSVLVPFHSTQLTRVATYINVGVTTAVLC